MKTHKGEYALKVRSNKSMRPLLHVGDVLLYSHRPIKRGDVVLYAAKNKVVVHRVLSFTMRHGEQSLLCKGDSMAFEDQWIIPRKCILGVLDTIVRGKKVISLHSGKFLYVNRILYILSRVHFCFRSMLSRRLRKKYVKPLHKINLFFLKCVEVIFRL